MCISWTIKCLILLMHGATMKYISRVYHLRTLKIIKARHRKLQTKIVDIIFQFLELVLDIWIRAKDIFKILHLATCKHNKASKFRPREPNRILQFFADAGEQAHNLELCCTV